MRTIRLVLSAAALAVTSAVWSADFQAGDLYYNFLDKDAATVEVAPPASGTYALAEVTVPSSVEHDGVTYSVTAIGERAFRNSSSLKKLTIPEGVTELKKQSLNGTTSMTELNLPASLRVVGPSALYYTGMTEFILPEGLLEIGEFGLYNNKNLTKVVIPSTCVTLGDHMLGSCDKLREVEILSPITEIPDHFMYGNSAPNLCDIRSFTIPETVISIGEYALGNTRLESMDIPANVKKIGRNAFLNCVMLKTVTLHDGLECIGGSAFEGCKALEEMRVPGTVKEWGYSYATYHRPFYNCSNLKTLVFEEGVTEIPNGCVEFSGMGVSYLHTVDIASTVTKIGDDAICGNTPWHEGASITFRNPVPLDYNQWKIDEFPSSTAAERCTIYVPAGAADAFKAHEIWGRFKNIVELASTEPTEPEPLPEQYKNSVGEGIYPIGLTLRWGDGKAIDNLTEAVYTVDGATIADVLSTALAEDPRFFAYKTLDGTYAAFGFDTNFKGTSTVSVAGEAKTLTGGIYTATAEGEEAAPSCEYDHWALNGEAGAWKYYLNGTEAALDAAVKSGDVVTLAYVQAEGSLPADEQLFYLRPADETGIWIPETMTIDTANGKMATFPFLANVGENYDYLYGTSYGIEILDPETKAAVTNLYSCTFTYGQKDKTTFDVTVKMPANAIFRPFLNIRKDWGDGKQTVKRLYGDDALISTTVAKPLTDITIEGIGEDGVINVDNMGVYILKPVYEPADADFPGYTAKLEDEAVATLYASVNAVVAHSAGETKLTISDASGSISKEYTVRVKGPDPESNPENFADGQLWLNEEWFGHTSGSINFVGNDGTFYPRVYGNANDNKAFGATSQFGTVYADRLVVMSKQAWDRGDTRPNPSGGRVVIADANTMKYLGSIDEIGGDGRACVGVNSSKMYLGTNSGIAILNLDECKVDSYVEVTMDRSGQIGDMVKSGRYVFATNVGTGLEIIDTEADAVVKSIAEKNIQGVAVSADGRVWMATGNTLTSINPETLEASAPYSIPGGITCSSYSWRSVNLLAARKSNTLFWGTGTFYRWNLDEMEDPSTLVPVYTHVAKEGDISYGNGYGAPGYDELTDTYMFATQPGFGAAALQNWYHFIDARTGEVKKRIHLPEYWWFPSMPVRSDRYPAEIDIDNFVLDLKDGQPAVLDLSALVTDKDDCDKAIVTWIEQTESADDNLSSDFEESAEPAKTVEIALDGKTLIVTPKVKGVASFVVAAESNGRVSRKNVTVTVDDTTGVAGVENGAALRGEVFTTNGVHAASFSDGIMPELPAGVYIVVTADGRVRKIYVK